MGKFDVRVERTEEYTIEIDESIINKEWLAKWSKVFHPVHDAEDLVRDLAGRIMQLGPGEFYEGYGHVKTYLHTGSLLSVWRNDKILKEEDYEPGIVVRLKEADEYFIDANEIE